MAAIIYVELFRVRQIAQELELAYTCFPLHRQKRKTLNQEGSPIQGFVVSARSASDHIISSLALPKLDCKGYL